jgi:hypothetical protein
VSARKGYKMPMTDNDKIKTSEFFRRISKEITACSWPDEDRPDVNARVEKFLHTADELEKQVKTKLSSEIEGVPC